MWASALSEAKPSLVSATLTSERERRFGEYISCSGQTPVNSNYFGNMEGGEDLSVWIFARACVKID